MKRKYNCYVAVDIGDPHEAPFIRTVRQQKRASRDELSVQVGRFETDWPVDDRKAWKRLYGRGWRIRRASLCVEESE
jgi:hypothetical protein